MKYYQLNNLVKEHIFQYFSWDNLTWNTKKIVKIYIIYWIEEIVTL